MKICICSDGYPSKGLPYSSFIQVLAREMVRQGCEVDVVAPQSLTNHFFRGGKIAPSYFKDNFEVDGVERSINVYRPRTLSFGEGLLGKWTPRFNRWATEFAIRKNHITPDVFYSHFWANAFNAERIARRNKKPLFVATGEDKINVTDFLSEDDVRKIKEGAAGVVCVSTKNKNESVKLNLALADKCLVLPNAYDPKEFYRIDKTNARKTLGFPLDVFIVAFCGRFNHRKGAMRLADAIRRLNNPKIKSIFIGSIADNETAQPECDGILFKGNLPHKDIVKYLNCADVFVLPSLAEGCPNSVIEAMACGLPIISSDLPFNSDILSNLTSILIDPNNIEQIADAINRVYENKALQAKLSDASILMSETLKINNRVAKILKFISDSHEKKQCF